MSFPRLPQRFRRSWMYLSLGTIVVLVGILFAPDRSMPSWLGLRSSLSAPLASDGAPSIIRPSQSSASPGNQALSQQLAQNPAPSLEPSTDPLSASPAAQASPQASPQVTPQASLSPSPEVSPSASPQTSPQANPSPSPSGSPQASPSTPTTSTTPTPGSSSGVTSVLQSLTPEVITNLSPDVQGILQRGKIIVATRGTSTPPFIMYSRDGDPCDNNSPNYTLADGSLLCGLDVEIGTALADALGIEVEFNTSKARFNEVADLVFTNQADLALSKLSLSLLRSTQFAISDPYVTLHQGLLINRIRLAEAASDEEDAIPVIRNLDQEVGVIRNTQYGLFARESFPKATVKEYDDWETTVAAVKNGEVMAAFRDELEVKRIVLSNPESSLRLKTAIFTDTEDQIVALVPWQNRQLLDVVNTYLNIREVHYSVDDLISKYPDVFGSQDS